MNDIKIPGCAPFPLANYLKALGLVNILSEKDKKIRCYWKNDSFFLKTYLSKEEIISYLLNDYSPTPIVDPWNGGSGFYPLILQNALDIIKNSKDPRLSEFKKAIEISIDLIKGRKEPPKKIEKGELIAEVYKNFRGKAKEVLPALVLLGDELSPLYPSIMASGGNDGRLDFANNYAQRIVDVLALDPKKTKFDQQKSQEALAEALWDETLPSNTLQNNNMGQFSPISAGGINCTIGFESRSFVNSWDFVLMMEALTFFSSSLTKRLCDLGKSKTSSPFSIQADPMAGPSRSFEEKNRGEQWLPLWERALSWREIKLLFEEGRIQSKKREINYPLDMLCAVSRLGVASGIKEFFRMAYVERNGQAYFAIPLNRIQVGLKKESTLVEELLPWIDRLQQHSPPKHFSNQINNFKNTLFNYLTKAEDDSPVLCQEVLKKAIVLEDLQKKGTEIWAGPLPKLENKWFEYTDDGSPEYRLARALSSVAPSLRSYWLPLNHSHKFYEMSDENKNRAVGQGHDLVLDLVAIIERLLIESDKQSRTKFPLFLCKEGGIEALPEDIDKFIKGKTNDQKIYYLARAFMAIQGHYKPKTPSQNSYDLSYFSLPWMTIKLAYSFTLEHKNNYADPKVIQRLKQADMESVFKIIRQRFLSMDTKLPFYDGLPPILDQKVALRWIAALAFPLSKIFLIKYASKMITNTKEYDHVDNH